jgi:hypothetical protein
VSDAFDVFISYNSEDRRIAKALCEILRSQGIRPWLDIDELRPGLSWQDGIEEALAKCESCAILIGASGFGPWHKREMQLALTRHASSFPVIPVLLPTVRIPPSETRSLSLPYERLRQEVPNFFSLLTWVDLRAGLDDEQGIERLLWGVTGRRPRSVRLTSSSEISSADETAFKIISPRNGDLISASTSVFGSGPPNEQVFLHYRLQDWDRFSIHTLTNTDAAGNWNCQFGHEEFHTNRPGVYELYAAGPGDKGMSQLVTITLGDTNLINADRAVASLSKSNVSVSAWIRTSHLRATKLVEGRIIHRAEKRGRIEDIQVLAANLASEVTDFFNSIAPSGPLQINVDIDEQNNVRISPSSVKALYYAFPDPPGAYGSTPGTDLQLLRDMVFTQLSWQVEAIGGKLPEDPFSIRYGVEAANEYLEIRHEGYRPEFVPLDKRRYGRYVIDMQPVLNRRIAVLGFPANDSKDAVPEISQLIVQQIVHSLESSGRVATYGYYSDEAIGRHRWDMGHAAIELGNEILTFSDVAMVEQNLSELDSAMVSGEGRHMRRRESEIHFTIRGNYTLF